MASVLRNAVSCYRRRAASHIEPCCSRSFPPPYALDPGRDTEVLPAFPDCATGLQPAIRGHVRRFKEKSAFPFLEKTVDPVCNCPTSSRTQSDDQTCQQCRCSALRGQFQNANCCSTSTADAGTNGHRSRSLDLVFVFLVHHANFNAWRVRLLETA